MKCVPATRKVSVVAGVVSLDCCKRTFTEDFLAHTRRPPILDRPVTTVDIEEAVLDNPSATSEQHAARNKGRNPGTAAGHAATEAASSAGALLDLALYPVEVVLHGIPG